MNVTLFIVTTPPTRLGPCSGPRSAREAPEKRGPMRGIGQQYLMNMVAGYQIDKRQQLSHLGRGIKSSIIKVKANDRIDLEISNIGSIAPWDQDGDLMSPEVLLRGISRVRSKVWPSRSSLDHEVGQAILESLASKPMTHTISWGLPTIYLRRCGERRYS